MKWLAGACLGMLWVSAQDGDPKPTTDPKPPAEQAKPEDKPVENPSPGDAPAEQPAPEAKQPDTSPEERIQALEKQVRELTEALQAADRNATAYAKEIVRLRQLISALEAENARLLEEIQRRVPIDKASIANPNGPSKPMTGLVSAVSKDWKFLLAVLKEAGEKPKEGYEFLIVKNGRNIAEGEAIKVEEPDGRSGYKLQIKVTKGKIDEIEPGDQVVAKRKLEHPDEPIRTEKGDATVDAVLGDGRVGITAGRLQNLRERDKVFLLRDGRVVAVLQLERVDLERSEGRVMPGTQLEQIRIGDKVHLTRADVEEKREAVIGQVAYAEKDIIIDIGSARGARPGQKYHVRRKGKSIGYVKVTDSQLGYSTCEPAEGTRRGDVQKGDIVELVRD